MNQGIPPRKFYKQKIFINIIIKIPLGNIIKFCNIYIEAFPHLPQAAIFVLLHGRAFVTRLISILRIFIHNS